MSNLNSKNLADIFQVNQQYSSLDDFMELFLHHSILNEITYKVKRRNKKRLELSCDIDKNCTFSIILTFNIQQSVYIVRTLNLVHSCGIKKIIQKYMQFYFEK